MSRYGHLFRTQFDASLLKSHQACEFSTQGTDAGVSQALHSCFAGTARAFVWVKTLHSWHSSAGSKTLWVTHQLYGRPIAPTLRTYPLLPTCLLTHASDSNHGRMRFEPYTQATSQVNNRNSHNISKFSLPILPAQSAKATRSFTINKPQRIVFNHVRLGSEYTTTWA